VQGLGFLFALDNFGTGTSSFGYLKHLAVDFLKIDGSFVKNMEHDGVDRTMTETTNRVGHIMGIRTVAKYAENGGIIETLRGRESITRKAMACCRPSPLLDAAPSASPQRMAV